MLFGYDLLSKFYAMLFRVGDATFRVMNIAFG